MNNVAGFGKKEITWEQFNKYIAKKVDKKGYWSLPSYCYHHYYESMRTKGMDQFLTLGLDISGFTLDSTFLNFDNLKEWSSTSFFLLDYFSDLLGTSTFGGDFLASCCSILITASLSFLSSSSCSAYVLQITFLMGVDGLNEWKITDWGFHRWTIHLEWTLHSTSGLIWPWPWSRYPFESSWFASITPTLTLASTQPCLIPSLFMATKFFPGYLMLETLCSCHPETTSSYKRYPILLRIDP